MRRKVVLTAALFFVVLSGVLFVGPPGRVTRGAGKAAPTTGDTNGDGAVDISDAIQILRYLFQDGKPPVACADSPELLTRVAVLEASIAELKPKVAKLASFASAVSIKMDLPCRCQGQAQCWYDGVVAFSPSDGHLIRKGTLAADGIRFSTDRDADLLFDFVWETKGGAGTPFLFFDGTSINGSPLSPTAPPAASPSRIFIPSVKAGDHLLTATGRALCNDSPQAPNHNRAQIDMVLKSLQVQYLE